MIQLACRQWWADSRQLVAQTATCLAACLALALATMLFRLELSQSGVQDEQGIFGSTLAATVLALAAVVASTSRLVVRQGRREYAGWIAAGVTPRFVAVIVSVRAFGGALFGSLLATPFIAVAALPVVRLSAASGLLAVTPSSGRLAGPLAESWLIATLVTVVVSLAATAPAARSASHTAPGRLLREEAGASRPGAARRWLLAAALVIPPIASTVGSMLLVAPLRELLRSHAAEIGPDLDKAERLLALSPDLRAGAVQGVVSISLVAATALVLPVVARRLTLIWTALLLPRWIPTIFLARALRAQSAGVSAAAIASGTLVIGLVASVQGAGDLARLLGSHTDSGWDGLAWGFGPALFVALIGTASSLIIGRGSADQEAQLLWRMGWSEGRIVTGTVLQSLMDAGTSLVVAGLIWAASIASGLMIASALGSPIFWSFPDPRSLLCAASVVAVVNSAAAVSGRAWSWRTSR